MLCIQAKEFNLGFIRPENLVSHGQKFAFWQTPCRLSYAFYWGVASIWPHYHKRSDWWSAAEMIVLLKRSPISTEEFWSSIRLTIGFLVISLTKALLPWLLSLVSSRKSLGGSKLLPFKNDRGHCVLGDLQCCRNLLVPFPRSVPQSYLGVLQTIPSTSWLSFCSYMHCQLWDII